MRHADRAVAINGSPIRLDSDSEEPTAVQEFGTGVLTDSRSEGIAAVVFTAYGGVNELGEQLRLAFKPFQSFSVLGELLPENLDRNLSAELRVACAIDLAHATDTELVDHFVVTKPASGREAHRTSPRAGTVDAARLPFKSE